MMFLNKFKRKDLDNFDKKCSKIAKNNCQATTGCKPIDVIQWKH